MGQNDLGSGVLETTFLALKSIIKYCSMQKSCNWPHLGNGRAHCADNDDVVIVLLEESGFSWHCVDGSGGRWLKDVQG